MATIILTAVGTVLGGPIGGAIGALAGSAVDAQLFKPAGRSGPRLSDLRVQTSAYGTQIPKLFGRMRVAGTVIWATDLVEHRETSGGGKNSPSVTTYNYSTSFAVALSSRPILRIERIWADGNLLRGAGGDFKSGLAAFRVHDGSENQEADPLVVGDRGAAAAPAHRGIAYAMFESLQLADFGNRIPSLTFEVVADEVSVSAASILSTLAGGIAVTAADDQRSLPDMAGYAASGGTIADAIGPIMDSCSLLTRDDAGGLALLGWRGDGRSLARGDDLARGGERAFDPREESRASAETVPQRLSLRYYEPSRDYQAGLQSAHRSGVGRSETQIDLPAVLPADNAREVARLALRQRHAARRGLIIPRGWAALALGVGDVVTTDGGGGRWRIETIEWEAMAVRLRLSALPGDGVVPAGVADPGQGIVQPDRVIGPSHLLLVETPQLGDAPVEAPTVYAAASGNGPGWRGAGLLLRGGAGDDYVPVGTIARPAVIGVATSTLPAACTALFDERSTLDVSLFDSAALLAPASDAAMLAGSNACMVGEELIQFGRVMQTGPCTYRLSRLLRGRRGTEGVVATHVAGEAFLLLDAARLFRIDAAQAVPGRTIGLAALGIGDAAAVTASLQIAGHAMLPPSPVHPRFEGDAATGLLVGWTRRSRMGWSWPDGAETPLGEEAERYALTVLGTHGALRSVETSMPAWLYDPAAIADDLGASESLAVSIRQIGTHGPGPALVVPLPLQPQ